VGALAGLKTQFFELREAWFDILTSPLGLLPHLVFFVVLGWLCRLVRGQSYTSEDIVIAATRGLSITMFVALFAGLADIDGLKTLLASGVGRSQLVTAMFLGLVQEIVAYFRRLWALAPSSVAPAAQPSVAS